VVHSGAVAAATVDLTNCDREPIHVPGAVQPHGLLLAFEPHAERVVQISENARALLGRDPAGLLQERLDKVLGRSAAAAVLRLAESTDVASAGVRLEIEGEQSEFDAIVHHSGGLVVVELEPAEPPPPGTLDAFFSLVRTAVARLQSTATVNEACDVLAAEAARVTGFDRTMVYRFDRDWNGAVVAERCVPELPPFLGLHYPASDIPRQARELYRRNALRLIPDASYTPARIVPALNPLTDAPLDLSRAVLRSVSPIHLRYLANMGVVASCSASILKHGELWGMVAMHHRTAHFVPYRARVACEMLARTAALQITALEESEEFAYRMRLRALQPALIDAVSREGGFTEAIAGGELLEIADAEGAAIRTEGEPILVGATPRLRHVRQLLAWLDQRGTDEEPFVTDSLALMNPDFEPCKDTASGLLAVPLTTTKGGWLLWFRPEVTRTVAWAGDPLKPVHDGGTLSPRESFATWKEVVANHARPWQQAQVDAAIELRRLLSDVMMRRAREYAKLNADLARSNEELESFAHIASHDLKEPLRGLSHYATFLREDYAGRLDDRAREMLDAMTGLTRRMETQIDSMLELARVGEDEPSGRNTDLGAALDEALALLGPRIQHERAEIRRTPLPKALMSPARAREVFLNLIGNALKYHDGGGPRIEIGVAPSTAPLAHVRASTVSPSGPMATVFVRDSGIGIRDKHLETVFRMFKRLHGQDRYGGGTGSGLAIARKIVERNGGSMWVESTYGQGSTFYFTVPVSEG
jgi:light-regulated signal transduction histidine kinase (bacteriophytochrome)